MNAQPVVAMQGAARVTAASRQLHIYGVERGSACTVSVTIGGYEPGSLPAELHDLTITALAAVDDGKSTSRHWQLCAGARRYEVSGRSIHVRRDATAAFYAAVPGARLSMSARVGWALLLNLLRVPGMSRLLGLLRLR